MAGGGLRSEVSLKNGEPNFKISIEGGFKAADWKLSWDPSNASISASGSISAPIGNVEIYASKDPNSSAIGGAVKLGKDFDIIKDIDGIPNVKGAANLKASAKITTSFDASSGYTTNKLDYSLGANLGASVGDSGAFAIGGSYTLFGFDSTEVTNNSGDIVSSSTSVTVLGAEVYNSDPNVTTSGSRHIAKGSAKIVDPYSGYGQYGPQPYDEANALDHISDLNLKYGIEVVAPTSPKTPVSTYKEKDNGTSKDDKGRTVEKVDLVDTSTGQTVVSVTTTTSPSGNTVRQVTTIKDDPRPHIQSGPNTVGHGHQAPLILDLDHDGIEITNFDGIQFDVDGDGYLESTNWADGDDGFLVIDLNADGSRGAGDGKIDQARELILTNWLAGGDATDLQALAQFDQGGSWGGNGDGKLTSADEIWKELKVWKDTNLNAVVDAGELKTLGAWGISQINLGYDDGTGFGDSRNNVEYEGNSLLGYASYTQNGQVRKGGVGDVALQYAESGQRNVSADNGYVIEFEHGTQYAALVMNGSGSKNTVVPSNVSVIEGDHRANTIDGTASLEELTFSGGSGNDTIKGGWNDDILSGGVGADQIIGGAGNDLIYFDASDKYIDGGEGLDTARVAAGNQYDVGVTLDLSTRNFEVAYGGNGADNFSVANDFVTSVVVNGLGGNDLIYTGLGDDNASGGEGADFIQTLAGDDEISGGSGNDVINAGSGSDVASGGGQNDTVNGGNGDDILYGDNGNDIVSGGNGDDYISGGSGHDFLGGGNDDDYIIAGVGNDTLNGGSGDDVGFGGDGADVFDAVSGDNVFYGENGNDLFYATKALTGKTEMFGGFGYDTLVLDGHSGEYSIIPIAGENQYRVTARNNLADPNRFSITLVDVEAVKYVGSSEVSSFLKQDTNRDSSGSYIYDKHLDNKQDYKQSGVNYAGQSGRDTIDGAEEYSDHHDTMWGGNGDDSIHGENGSDTLYGQSGSDYIRGDGEAHLYRSYATSGDDIIYGGSGADALLGDAGNDRIFGQSGEDTIYGDVGDDFINGGSGTDYIVAGSGNDVVQGGDAVDYLFGDDGNDTIYGHDGADKISGGAGFDSIFGGMGDDYIYDTGSDTSDTDPLKILGSISVLFFSNRPSVEADEIHGGEGNDTIKSGNGNDLVYGGNGLDFIVGGWEDDKLYGNNGNDTVLGGQGRDYLAGGAGMDFLEGGNGADTLDGHDASGVDNPMDLVSYVNSSFAVNINLATGKGSGGHANGDVIRNVEWAQASHHNDTVIGDNKANRLLGLNGNDTIDGAGGNDTIVGGDGNDRLTGDRGDDRLEGGTGNDQIDAGDGNDLVLGQNGDDNVRGHNGDDTVRGGEGHDTVTGDNGNDVLGGDGGMDELWGWNGNDRLDGGAGNDTLYGEQGNDTLTGGAGNDQFVWVGKAGYDVVTDFQNGSDSIKLDDRYGDFSIYSGEILVKSSGINTLVEFSSSSTIMIEGVSANLITGADFVNLGGWTLKSGSAATTHTDPITPIDNSLLPSQADYNNFRDFGSGQNGTSANDWIVGTSAGEKIKGGAGDDYIDARGGNDAWVTGGSGNDIFEFGTGDGTLQLGDFLNGNDQIYLADGLDIGTATRSASFAGNGDARVEYVFSSGEKLSIRGAIDENFDLSNYLLTVRTEQNTPTNNSSVPKQTDYESFRDFGANQNGTGSADWIIGTSGSDRIRGGGGDDYIRTGKGNDSWVVGQAGNDIFEFAAGDDRLQIGDFLNGQDEVYLNGLDIGDATRIEQTAGNGAARIVYTFDSGEVLTLRGNIDFNFDLGDHLLF